jgi:hypothetical protein
MRLLCSPRFLPWLAALALLAGCGDDTSAGPSDSGFDAGPGPVIDPTYAEVERIVDRSCTFSACHGGRSSGVGALNMKVLIDDGIPITEVLVDVPACQYHLMPRIDPGNPDNSWLWIKLDPASMDDTGAIVFTPDPSFDATQPNPHYDSPNCPLDPGDFGLNMPFSDGHPSPLRLNELTAIREWIEMGAPGPDTGEDAGVGDAAVEDAAVEDAAVEDAAVEDAAVEDAG